MNNGSLQLMQKRKEMINRVLKNSVFISCVVLTLFICGCHTSKNIPIVSANKEVVKTTGNPIRFQNDTMDFYYNYVNYGRLLIPVIDTVRNEYEFAYSELKEMLINKDLDFKKSVFIVENAYFNGALNYSIYSKAIDFYTNICQTLFQSNKLTNYPYSDSLNLRKNFAIFSLMKDTILLDGYKFSPVIYDFEEGSGEKEWSTTFVKHLMQYGKGNCHSMPYFYKILADEIGAEAYLSLAPNHLYLKHRSKRLGWYNTELTSGQFPSDAWVKASGYITLDAIRNGIYMDTLGQEQSIALCVYDLAMGYSQKTGRTLDGFIIKCCDLTLKYHPQNINAIILKAETLKSNYEYYIKTNNTDKANACFSQMKQLYVQGVRLGYREMPKEMYLAWLQSSVTGNQKFVNSSINETLNLKTK